MEPTRSDSRRSKFDQSDLNLPRLQIIPGTYSLHFTTMMTNYFSRSNFVSLMVAVILTLLIGITQAEESNPVAADTIIYNAAVYTVDKTNSRAEAIAIKQGVIVYVGNNQGVERCKDNNTRVIDLKGRMLLPSFNDPHMHMLSGKPTFESKCVIPYRRMTNEQLKVEVQSCHEKYPGDGWLVIRGWIPIPIGELPTRVILDEVSSTRPIALVSTDAHNMLVNTKVLETAKINRHMPNPDGHIVVADDGEPTGWLKEEINWYVFLNVIPQLPRQEQQANLENTLQSFNRYGITAITEAATPPPAVEMFKTFSRAGKLSGIRVNLALLLFAPADFDEAILDYFIKTRADLEGDDYPNLSARTIKIFADGVFPYPNQTSALIEPYNKFVDPGCLDNASPCEKQQSTYRAKVKVAQDKLNKVVQVLDKQGFQVHIHAEGDQAIRSSLDAFAQTKNGRTQTHANRHTLAHASLIHPQDLPRFTKYNVSASVTFAWAVPNMQTNVLVPFLGKERHKRLFSYKSMLDSGTRLVAVTDWPGSTLDLLQHLETGISRKTAEPYGGMPGGNSFYGEQGLALGDVIQAFTANGAYSMFLDKQTGSIEVRKKADLVVLSKDLFAVPVEAISEVDVDMTFFNGRLVYSR